MNGVVIGSIPCMFQWDGYLVKNGVIDYDRFGDFLLKYGTCSRDIEGGYLLFNCVDGYIEGYSLPIDVSKYNTLKLDYYMTSARSSDADYGCIDISPISNDLSMITKEIPSNAITGIYSDKIGGYTVKSGTLTANVQNMDTVYVNISANATATWQTRILNIYVK